MSPLDASIGATPSGTAPVFAAQLAAGGTLQAPVLPPVIDGFDPLTELLEFTLSPGDEDSDLRLRDLPGGACRLEIGDRVLAIFSNLRADDIDPDALRFEFA